MDEDTANDLFWEMMYEKHWEQYLKSTEHPRVSDFMIWCEDNDLVPEMDYVADEDY